MAAKRASKSAKSGRVFGQPRKQAKMFRVGLYARVSTEDQQTLPMQNRTMGEYAVRRGWTVAMQVNEVSSGAAHREARERLMEAARRREVDVVLVWRLDRDVVWAGGLGAARQAPVVTIVHPDLRVRHGQQRAATGRG